MVTITIPLYHMIEDMIRDYCMRASHHDIACKQPPPVSDPTPAFASVTAKKPQKFLKADRRKARQGRPNIKFENTILSTVRNRYQCTSL